MNLAEKIIETIKDLPELKRIEVFDFLEFLQSKTEKQENLTWKGFSLTSAMRGMEDEQSPYSLNDLKESFT